MDYHQSRYLVDGRQSPVLYKHMHFVVAPIDKVQPQALANVLALKNREKQRISAGMAISLYDPVSLYKKNQVS